jgi:hypothetical protein
MVAIVDSRLRGNDGECGNDDFGDICSSVKITSPG